MIRDEYGNAYPAPGPFWNLDQLRREHRDRGGPRSLVLTVHGETP